MLIFYDMLIFGHLYHHLFLPRLPCAKCPRHKVGENSTITGHEITAFITSEDKKDFTMFMLQFSLKAVLKY